MHHGVQRGNVQCRSLEYSACDAGFCSFGASSVIVRLRSPPLPEQLPGGNEFLNCLCSGQSIPVHPAGIVGIAVRLSDMMRRQHREAAGLFFKLSRSQRSIEFCGVGPPGHNANRITCDFAFCSPGCDGRDLDPQAVRTPDHSTRRLLIPCSLPAGYCHSRSDGSCLRLMQRMASDVPADAFLY